MNLYDLMEVWRSQDAAPMHGVNETLLRLALRQDEANLRGEAAPRDVVRLHLDGGARRPHGGGPRHHVPAQRR
jgi:hypothetical protein